MVSRSRDQSWNILLNNANKVQLQAQTQADGQPGWANLVVPAVIPEQGLFLRALSPNNGISKFLSSSLALLFPLPFLY